ncbi:MAG: NUDIX domain-containing protein [Candidatus Uhrbacteria bacterium]|nr:NUDIX domain-containing protein [Candidatus Uhrbacteria bacterium]
MQDEIYKKVDAKRGEDYIGVCVVFFCHDGAGRVLLHRRAQACRDEQGRWDCGGGSMEHGEDWEGAIRREVKEEYCVDPTCVDFVCAENVLRDNNGVKTHWIALLHLVLVDPSQVDIGEPDKIDEIGWFLPGEFPEPGHSMLQSHFELVKDLIRPSLGDGPKMPVTE